jgi:hypothetical protein
MNTLKRKGPRTTLFHTGSYFKSQGENTRNAKPRLPVGKVTAKPATVTIRESEGA